MLSIKDLEQNVIDLNGIKEYSEDFEILSINKNGKRLPLRVDLVSTPSIKLNMFNVSSINITIDVKSILKEEFVILKNLIGEKLILRIMPNEYYTNERIYKFKATKKEVNKNGDIKIKIISQVNDMEIGWKCTYDGSPISYEIKPKKSSKSGTVTIKSLMEMTTDYVSTVIFEQEESGETIEVKINNTPQGMELVK